MYGTMACRPRARSVLHCHGVLALRLYTESFRTQTCLHTETFTQRSLYTEFLHREIFTQTRFHTEKLSHTEESFYTKKSLHRNFYTEKLLHTKAFTQRSLCTEAPLHEVTRWNWQQFFRKNPSQELSGTHFLPKNRLFPTNVFQET